MAKNTTVAVWILVVAVVGLLGLVGVNQFQQTAIDQVTPEEAKKEEAVTSGVLAQVRARTIDKESPTEAQVSTSFYAWDKAKPDTLIANGVSTSATAGTDTLVSGFVKGTTIEYTGFANSTYYGGELTGNKGTLKLQEIFIDDESETVEAQVHTIISQAQEIRISDASTETILDMGGGTGVGNSLINITLDSADATEDIDWFRLKINQTDASFYLDSLVFDTPADSNIREITVEGMDPSSSKIEFLSDKQNFRFTPSGGNPIFLRDSQTFQTGLINLKSKANVVTEDVDVYFIDRQRFKSISNGIKEGVENDAETELDIGAHSDLTRTQFSVN